MSMQDPIADMLTRIRNAGMDKARENCKMQMLSHENGYKKDYDL